MQRIQFISAVLLILILQACGSSKKIPSSNILDVSKYGVESNDSKEDSETIQKIIELAKLNGIDTIFFPKGTYLVNSVNVYPGVVYLGEKGTLIKKVPYAGKWSRMFTTQNIKYENDLDSEELVFLNLEFDGDYQNQGPYKDYELQQQHILYFDAQPTKKGRLKGRVENCHFKNSVGDAISLWRNADVIVRNCTAYNVFRGGVVATGGYSKLYVENFTAGGNTDLTGIDVEIDAAGYGGKKNIDVTLSNLQLEGDFDIIIPENGSLIANKIVSSGPKFNLLIGENSRATIKNSEFYIGGLKRHVIYFPNNVTFQNCRFNIHEEDEVNGLKVFMETRYKREGNHYLLFNDCTFQLMENSGKSNYGIFNEENFTHLLTNVLELNDCQFIGDFTASMIFKKGGNLRMNNILSKGEFGIEMNSQNGKTPVVLDIKNWDVSPSTSVFKHHLPSTKDHIKIDRLKTDPAKMRKSRMGNWDVKIVPK